jgi:hypothetical protein
MNPDAQPERVIRPGLIAVRWVEPAAERQTKRTGARAGPVGATVKAQRVGACLGRVGQPQQLKELLAPCHPPVLCSLPAVRLSGVQHPPIVFKALRRRTGSVTMQKTWSSSSTVTIDAKASHARVLPHRFANDDEPKRNDAPPESTGMREGDTRACT